MAKKPLSDILGGVTRFGDYEVIDEGASHPKDRMCVCRCKCGAVKQVSAQKLKSGRSTCCASCAKKSEKRITNLRHGMSKSVEYDAWTAMRYRCTNPACWNYADYGGRGISICEEWMRSFDCFFEDMGPRPEGCSLDRIDNELGYFPGNCRWATSADQQQNRRVTRTANWQGENIPLSRLEKQAGLPRGVLAARLKMGWDISRAVSEPALVKKPTHDVFGEPLTTKEICVRFGIDRQSFNRWLRLGWSAERVVAHYR